MHDSARQGSSTRQGLTFRTIETPIGGLTLAVDGAGVLRMAEFADRQDRMEQWLRRRPELDDARRLGGGADIDEAFAAYFSGDLPALDGIAVRLDGTPFQTEIWTALRAIAPGEVVGYGAFAERLGRPRAARAVGHANGANPLSVVVPCHRLVGANGALTNYGGGLERKRWLLDHERRHAAG